MYKSDRKEDYAAVSSSDRESEYSETEWRGSTSHSRPTVGTKKWRPSVDGPESLAFPPRKFRQKIEKSWTRSFVVFGAALGLGLAAYYYSNPLPQIQVYAPAPGEPTTWVVITSINDPTDAVERVCNDPSVQGVIVGDTKSPKVWSSGHCVYLDVEKQKLLGYSIVAKTPFRAYTRKNIGYLYAIARGAQVIFDTDDDNLVTTKEIAMLKAKDYPWGLLPSGDALSVNVYSYFGRPDIWPRGYPLEDYNDKAIVRTTPTTARPLIQQGLADLDPDVDAIYRLTRPSTLTKVNFHNQAPAVIPPGVFSPFNSQNTYFAYEALWGTMIPTTTSFRVCDIWRGYFAQRLLWEIGGAVGFTPPTVDQVRNAHNYLDDFIDEIDLYEEAGRLVRFLSKWRCEKATLPECMLSLAKEMADLAFWERSEVSYVRSWISDLTAVGYKFPALLANATVTAPAPVPRLADATLILSFNNEVKSTDHLDFLKSMYMHYFHDIVFAVPELTNIRPQDWKNKNIIECPSNPGGYFMHDCLRRVMETHPSRTDTGFFFMADDLLIDMNILSKLDLSRNWIGTHNGFPLVGDPPRVDWFWWTANIFDIRSGSLIPIGRSAFDAALDSLPPNWKRLPKGYNGYSDHGYIRNEDVAMYKDFAQHFRSHNVFNEIAHPSIMALIQEQTQVTNHRVIHKEYRSMDRVIEWCEAFQNGTNTVGTLHTFKFGTSSEARKIAKYCYKGCRKEEDCPDIWRHGPKQLM